MFSARVSTTSHAGHRWLVAKGRDGEAIAVLAKYHANNRERDPLVYFTYGQIREALSIERDVSKSTTYLTLFKTPGNRRRMRIVLAIGFFSQWSGNGLVSYYVRINPTSRAKISDTLGRSAMFLGASVSKIPRLSASSTALCRSGTSSSPSVSRNSHRSRSISC